MIIQNIKIYTEEQNFKDGILYIKNGIFDKIIMVPNFSNHTNDLAKCADQIIDGKGYYAIPGLIDIHFHGCMGMDFCDGTKEAIATLAKQEAKAGITAIAPATLTLPIEKIEKILSTTYEYTKSATNGADLVGINMEGPFISHSKKGAQDGKSILSCDETICQRFLKASGGLVKFIGIAPEVNSNYLDFIKNMKDEVNISLAHTNADYETAKTAFDAGANHVVHLYNAMTTFTHRSPGVVGAVSDSPHVMAELICDGIHVHPSVVRSTIKTLGKNRVIMVSDSMRATGMPDGYYTLGTQKVRVEKNQAVLASNGTLAGSVSNLMDCLKTAVSKMKIPLETAVACTTINPAKRLGIDDKYGSISIGKKANLVLLDKKLTVKSVIKDGRIIVPLETCSQAFSKHALRNCRFL